MPGLCQALETYFKGALRKACNRPGNYLRHPLLYEPKAFAVFVGSEVHVAFVMIAPP